jgi:hypothetical protein
MTETQALNFLRKVEKIWLWRKNLSAGQVIRQSRNNCFSIIGLSLAAVFIAPRHIVNDIGFWRYVNIVLVVYCFIATGISIWLLIRLRQAQRSLH